MIIYIDIDDTICTNSIGLDYSKATPIKSAIEKANKLYDDGHIIIYWTARGTMSGIDFTDITKEQFKKWGVKYHELKFNKPVYDLFIDDKNISTKEWMKS